MGLATAEDLLYVEQGKHTIDEIYALPDGERAEIIDGHIYMMAPPSRKHQKIQMELSAEIRNYIKRKKGNCEVYPAPFAVFLNKDDKNYVEPDISVICDKSKLDDKGCNGRPDFIIEIVSLASKKLDYNTKLAKYITAGVREYWIVDPLKERITVYFIDDDYMPYIYIFKDTIKVNIYDDLYIDFSKLDIE